MSERFTARPHYHTHCGPDGATDRELQVAGLVALGVTNAEIAQALAIEENTAKTHVRNLLEKTGLRRREQLIVWAIAHGVVAADLALKEIRRVNDLRGNRYPIDGRVRT